MSRGLSRDYEKESLRSYTFTLIHVTPAVFYRYKFYFLQQTVLDNHEKIKKHLQIFSVCHMVYHVIARKRVYTFTLYSPKAINHLGNVLHSCRGLCISGFPNGICIDQCVLSCNRSQSAHNMILALVAKLSTPASIHFLLFSSAILADLESVV